MWDLAEPLTRTLPATIRPITATGPGNRRVIALFSFSAGPGRTVATSRVGGAMAAGSMADSACRPSRQTSTGGYAGDIHFNARGGRLYSTAGNEAVLIARRGLLVAGPQQNAAGDQRGAAVGEDVAYDPEVALEGVEAPHAAERVARYE